MFGVGCLCGAAIVILIEAFLIIVYGVGGGRK